MVETKCSFPPVSQFRRLVRRWAGTVNHQTAKPLQFPLIAKIQEFVLISLKHSVLWGKKLMGAAPLMAGQRKTPASLIEADFERHGRQLHLFLCNRTAGNKDSAENRRLSFETVNSTIQAAGEVGPIVGIDYGMSMSYARYFHPARSLRRSTAELHAMPARHGLPRKTHPRSMHLGGCNLWLSMNRIWISWVGGFLTTLVLYGPAAADLPQSTNAEIQTWVEALQSEDFAVREWAAGNLLARGADVIEPLSKRITQDHAESALRSLEVLHALTLSEPRTSTLASDAIRRIAENKAAASSIHAAEILQAITPARAKRAEKILRRLGAEFSTINRTQLGGSFSGQMVPMVSFGNSWSGTLEDLAFLDWLKSYRELAIEADGPQITDAFLKSIGQVENVISLKLRRCAVTDQGMEVIPAMPSLLFLRVYYCNLSDRWLKALQTQPARLESVNIFGGDMTTQAVESLSQKRPRLLTRYGKGGFLGIRGSASPNGDGCLVVEVTANGAASKAEILPEDLIVEYDGQPVTQFSRPEQRMRRLPAVLPQNDDPPAKNENLNQQSPSLSELIGMNSPGEVVTIKLKRGQAFLTKKVKLSMWP